MSRSPMWGNHKAARGWRILLLMMAGCLWLKTYAVAASIPLDNGWKLQSSCVEHASGDLISTTGFPTKGWLNALVPGTVLGSQVAGGVFPDPFFGMNLRKIPGTDYPITKIFGYLPMGDNSPYRCSWWYRVEFDAQHAPAAMQWLHFDGINYRANLWLNGKKFADSADVAGTFRAYDFDISGMVHSDRRNVLAVEVFAQTEKDLGQDFLDWNPAPADKSMGLWRNVSLRTTGPVTVRYPAASTRFLKDDLSEAELSVVADVANHSRHPVSVSINATVGSIPLRQTVELAANESRIVRFDAEHFPQLRVQHPQIWWPYQYGQPHLEKLVITASVLGVESDQSAINFGIREVSSTLNDKGSLQFTVNRRTILIRGGGWTPDLFYREPRDRLRQELEYVKQMHLNAIRLEGKLGSDALFDLADEMGILVMAGWQCCDYWQQWNKWTAQDREIANASQWTQISRLRAHPSLLVWLNGSDEAPSESVEKDFLAILKERDWPDAVMNSAADRNSKVSGPSGVKMSGPYDYVPPEYWYLDTAKAGGAFGFNTETGPGPSIPSAEAIRKTLPRTSWWPIDEQWKYHAGLGKFAQYDNFNRAMNATYGEPLSLDAYAREAQLMAYDGERAMFEAYGANKYTSTGVIQWMLNNAWPSFIWHLYDYSLIPGGGYFGTRKANEPLHIQYRYDDRRVVVVNSMLAEHKSLHAAAELFSLDGKVMMRQAATVDVAADGVSSAFTMPAQQATVFLKLQLTDAGGKTVSRNFYWIPAKLAELAWDKTTYVNTPAKRYADMRDTAKLPQAMVKAEARQGKRQGELILSLENNTAVVAFFLHASVVRKDKAGAYEEVAPTYWEDNFISLTPGESRTLTVYGLPDAPVAIRLDGMNLAERIVTVKAD